MAEANHTTYLNLNDIPCYSKFEIAEHQLERAIILFLDESDYISATTLAGASEEIFGALLNENKQDNEFEERLKMFAFAFGKGWKEHENWFKADMNYYRNNLKHHSGKSKETISAKKEPDPEFISIYPDIAIQMIDRALSNFYKLSGKQSENMLRYSQFKNC